MKTFVTINQVTLACKRLPYDFYLSVFVYVLYYPFFEKVEC